MAASASASCSIDDLAGNEASGAASAPEEYSQIEEDISEAVTEDEGYSDEDFAEATVDADKSRADHSQSISQSVDQIQSASHSKSLPSSPPSLPLHPPSTSVRPLVGIGSPPKPERPLSEAASAAPSAAAPSRPENDDLQSEQDESYSEDFAEGTLGSSKRAGTAKESLAESLQSYSDDFAEGSATAGKSQSGTFEMSEALSSASRSGGRQRAAEEELQRVAAEAEHRKAEALQRESEEKARRQAEDERLKAEAEMRARVEERRRQIAETQQKAAQVVHVSTAARPTPAEGDGRAISDAAVSEDLEEIEEDEELSMHLQREEEEKQEEERARIEAEEAKIKADEERKRSEAELEKKKVEEEERKRAADERSRIEAVESQRKDEEERVRMEAEAETKRKAEEERQQAEKADREIARLEEQERQHREVEDNARRKKEADEERARNEPEEAKQDETNELVSKLMTNQLLPKLLRLEEEKEARRKAEALEEEVRMLRQQAEDMKKNADNEQPKASSLDLVSKQRWEDECKWTEGEGPQAVEDAWVTPHAWQRLQQTESSRDEYKKQDQRGLGFNSQFSSKQDGEAEGCAVGQIGGSASWKGSWTWQKDEAWSSEWKPCGETWWAWPRTQKTWLESPAMTPKRWLWTTHRWEDDKWQSEWRQVDWSREEHALPLVPPLPYTIGDQAHSRRKFSGDKARGDHSEDFKNNRWLQELRLGLPSNEAPHIFAKSAEHKDRLCEQEAQMPDSQHHGTGEMSQQFPIGIANSGGQRKSAPLHAVPPVTLEGFSDSVAQTLSEVVDELLALKYNLGLDVAAFVKEVESSCEGYATLSLERVLSDLNSKSELRCLDKRKEYELQLQFGYRRLKNFEELRHAVQLIPGTASAAAVITVGRPEPTLDVVAAFRSAYSDASRIVGRSGRAGGQPLQHFNKEDFCGGVAVDPIIIAMWPLKGSAFSSNAAHAPPSYSLEYVNLEPLLKYVHGDRHTASRISAQSVPPSIPPALIALIHAASPTEDTMRRVSEVLERHDVDPEGMMDLLRKLAEWLKHETSAMLVRKGFASARAHNGLIATMRRHSGHRELAAWACRVIGWAARSDVDTAVLFVEARAIREVCRLLEQHRVDKDIHRHGLYAIGCLAHFGGGTPQALDAGAFQITLRSLTTHRDSATVHINGCETLRCLAEMGGEAPVEDFAKVAQEAKRAFPRDKAVHRSADALLTLVVPRMVRSVSMLMDTKIDDPEVQNSAARTLGQLAGYGGVAWKSSASGAVSRIMRAMVNHRCSVALQAVCLWALGRLAERVEAPTAGMYDAAEHAKKQHSDSALVCRHADQLCEYLMRP